MCRSIISHQIGARIYGWVIFFLIFNSMPTRDLQLCFCVLRWNFRSSVKLLCLGNDGENGFCLSSIFFGFSKDVETENFLKYDNNTISIFWAAPQFYMCKNIHENILWCINKLIFILFQNLYTFLRFWPVFPSFVSFILFLLFLN